MIFRLFEFTWGMEYGFSLGTIIWDDGPFNALLAGIYNVDKKVLFVCILGWKCLFDIGVNQDD